MSGKLPLVLCCYLITIFQGLPALAHFGMVIPSDNIFTYHDKEVELSLSFSHPFEGIGMDLARPEKFYVVKDGRKSSLLNSLQPSEIMEGKGWRTSYTLGRPGVYHFVMEPVPYWEEAEGLFIIHYTKTTVAAYGAEKGWDRAAGLQVEIVPLVRPFGNYAGNIFTGRVVRNGKPAPGAEVEVEFYNPDNSFEAATGYHVTQTVLADENGVFSFACPEPGWWGFSALFQADYELNNPAWKKSPVELGAVFWIYLDEWKSGK